MPKLLVILVFVALCYTICNMITLIYYSMEQQTMDDVSSGSKICFPIRDAFEKKSAVG